MADNAKQVLVYRVTPLEGATRTLQREQRVTIGRHPSNDVVLRHISVSRHHATLEWKPDAEFPVLIDEGSANGVFVDGVAVVGQAPVTARVEVEIGDVLIVVEPSTVVATQPEPRGVARGQFTDAAKIHRMLLRLEERQESGVLRLAGDSARYEITIRAGHIVAATCPDEDLQGGTALEHALALKSGGYRFVLKEVAADVGDLDLSPRAFVQLRSPDATSPADPSSCETARWDRVSVQIGTLLSELQDEPGQ